MKVYTKTGDAGSTALLGGTRVGKQHIRIEAYGTVDELNSFIGLLRDQNIAEGHKKMLLTIQERLFTLGATLATDPDKKAPLKPDLHPEDIALLEQAIDRMEEGLPPLRHFILPGGHVAVSQAHVARCVCRRAERLAVALAENSPVEADIIRFLNRLSDYLFVLARKLAAEAGVPDPTRYVDP